MQANEQAKSESSDDPQFRQTHTTEQLQQLYVQEFCNSRSLNHVRKVREFEQQYIKNAKLYIVLLVTVTVGYFMNRELDLDTKIIKILGLNDDRWTQPGAFQSNLASMLLYLIAILGVLAFVHESYKAIAHQVEDQPIEITHTACERYDLDEFEYNKRQLTKVELEKLFKSPEYQKYLRNRGARPANWQMGEQRPQDLPPISSSSSSSSSSKSSGSRSQHDDGERLEAEFDRMEEELKIESKLSKVTVGDLKKMANKSYNPEGTSLDLGPSVNTTAGSKLLKKKSSSPQFFDAREDISMENMEEQ